MTIRPYLLENHRERQNAGYTFAELVALRAAGRDIPDHWLTRTKRDEDQAADQAAMNASIVAELAAAEEAHAAGVAATEAKYLPVIRKHLDKAVEHRAAANEQYWPAVDAVRAYLDSVRAASSEDGAARRIVRDKFPEAKHDHDGNPLPGQTHLRQGTLYVEGEAMGITKVAAPFIDLPRLPVKDA